MSTGKLQYKLTPLAEKMAAERGYPNEPQQMLDKDFFNELVKRKDIATIMFNGGTDLTKDQLRQARELISKTPEKKLRSILKSMEGTVGYQNLISLPIVSKILQTKKKKAAVKPKVNKQKPKVEDSSDDTEQPAEEEAVQAQQQFQPTVKSATLQPPKKEPAIAPGVANVMKPLMKSENAVEILDEIYSFLRMDHASYLKNMRDDKKMQKKLEDIKESRNLELIDLFTGKKLPQKEKPKLETKKDKSKAKAEPKKSEPTNQVAQKSAPEAPKATAEKVTPAPSVVTPTAVRNVAIGAGVAAAILPTGAIAGVIDDAAKTVGVDTSIMYAMAKQESGFNPNAAAKTSSAKGLFQFIDSTWKSIVQKYGSQYPILRQRKSTDPEANALAGALYIKENSEILSKAGIPITATNIYASHFLGPSGAKTLLTANPNADASKILPQAASSNKTIFFEMNGKSPDMSRPKTVAQVVQTLYHKVGKLSDQYAAILGNKTLLTQNQNGERLDSASKQNRDLKQQSKAGGTNVSVLNNSTNVINGGTTYQSTEEDASLPPALAKQYKS